MSIQRSFLLVPFYLSIPPQLRASLMGFPLSQLEAAPELAQYPAREVLWNQIVGRETVPPIPKVVYWFHATRVRPETDFAEGIQPLGERLPAIKDFLTALAARLDLGSSPPTSSLTAVPSTVPAPPTIQTGVKVNLPPPTRL